jgi:hypothetical protein
MAAPYLVVVEVHGGSMSFEASSDREALKIATERLTREPGASSVTIYTPALCLEKAGIITTIIATGGGLN